MAPQSIFTLFGRDVHLYGVFIAIGLLCCMVVFFIYTTKTKMPDKVQDYVYFVAIIAIAVGFLSAKFFQAIYNYVEEISEVGIKNAHFDFYNAGLTVMGGIVGGVVSFLVIYFTVGHFLFKGKTKGLHKNYIWDIVNVCPLCITVAHGFGRLGCLMAGCCHGMFLGKEKVFGGIFMHTWDLGSGYFIPVQLYESIFLFVLFAVLSVLYFKGCKITMPIYLFAYGTWRFIIEFFRHDHRGGFVLNLSPSQWQSFLFIFAGIAILLFFHFTKRKFFQPIEKKNEIKE